MATVQVIRISLLCCHVLHPNNCAAVLYHFRSTLKRKLYIDKYSWCGTLQIKSPFTYTFITHWMAGVHVIWFSVPFTHTTIFHLTCVSKGNMHLCKCNDSAAFFHHFLQYADVFCIHQWSVHVVHYKLTDKLHIIVSLNVWRPCKWFTFHCYVVMSCIPTTLRQFSTTFGPHWNVSYTLVKTAGVVHHRSAVRSRILLSVTEWQAFMLSDFQCRLHAYMQM